MASSVLPNAVPTRRASARTQHLVILIAALIVIALSMLLSLADSEGQVLLPFIATPLPPLCSMKRMFGIDCPGCGLTRSFVSLAHGQWNDAFRFNPAGPLWFGLVALQIPWQTFQIARIARGEPALNATWYGFILLYAGIAALILQWVVRQLGGF